MGMKIHNRVHVKVGKSDNLRIHTEILDLTMQKVSQDILMIICHKSYHILYLKNERKNKVALAVELSIMF